LRGFPGGGALFAQPVSCRYRRLLGFSTSQVLRGHLQPQGVGRKLSEKIPPAGGGKLSCGGRGRSPFEAVPCFIHRPSFRITTAGPGFAPSRRSAAGTSCPSRFSDRLGRSSRINFEAAPLGLRSGPPNSRRKIGSTRLGNVGRRPGLTVLGGTFGLSFTGAARHGSAASTSDCTSTRQKGPYHRWSCRGASVVEDWLIGEDRTGGHGRHRG